MAAKFQITAIRRTGFAGTYRAGRFFSSEEPTVVELVDEDDDPEQKPDEPLKIGRRTYALIEQDPKLSIRPAGDPVAMARAVDDVPTLRSDIERLTAENEQLRAQLGTAATQQSHAVGEESGGRRGRRHTEGG